MLAHQPYFGEAGPAPGTSFYGCLSFGPKRVSLTLSSPNSRHSKGFMRGYRGATQSPALSFFGESKATLLPQPTLEQRDKHVHSGDDETKGTVGPKLDQIDPGTPWELHVRAQSFQELLKTYDIRCWGRDGWQRRTRRVHISFCECLGLEELAFTSLKSTPSSSAASQATS